MQATSNKSSFSSSVSTGPSLDALPWTSDPIPLSLDDALSKTTRSVLAPMPALGSITDPTPLHLNSTLAPTREAGEESESDEEEMDFFSLLRTDPIPLARVLREKTSQEDIFRPRPAGSVPPPPKTFTIKELQQFRPDRGSEEQSLSSTTSKEDRSEKSGGFWSIGSKKPREDRNSRRISHLSLRSAKAFLLGHAEGEGRDREPSTTSKVSV